MRMFRFACASLVIAGILGLACASKPPKEPVVVETVVDAGPVDAAPPEPPAPKSLYERIGGKDVLAKVVDAFVKNVQSNDITKKRMRKLSKDKLAAFRESFTDQLCQESGGDCTYAGKDMAAAHKGMKITEAEWSAFISAFKAAMDEQELGDNEQNDLIAILAPMHDDIVEAKGKTKKK